MISSTLFTQSTLDRRPWIDVPGCEHSNACEIVDVQIKHDIDRPDPYAPPPPHPLHIHNTL